MKELVALYVVLGVSVVFYLMRASTHAVAVVATATLMAGFGYAFVAPTLKEADPPGTALAKRENKEALVPAVASPLFPVNKVPRKGFKYLAQSTPLLDLLQRIRIVRMFDRPRFQELALTLDHFHKTYIYVLGRRTIPRHGVPLFFDLRDRVLQLLYSMHFIVPKQPKHVYGLDPLQRLDEATATFTAIADKMTSVLKDFVTHDLKTPWTFDDELLAANRRSDASMLP